MLRLRGRHMQARVRLLFTLAVLLCPSIVCAGGTALRWDSCYGDGGTANRTFACNSASGVNTAVGSFVTDVSMSAVGNFEAIIDVRTASAVLPEWWRLVNSGACRQTALSFAPFDRAACRGVWAGQGVPQIISYQVDTNGPSSARIHISAGVPYINNALLFPGIEYAAFAMTITNEKSAGAEACDGCSIPACIAFTSISFGGLDFRPRGGGYVAGPAFGGDSQFLSWQGVSPFPGDLCVGFDSLGFAVNVSVAGRGTVTRSRTKMRYPPGSPLTLVARPNAGDRFVEWAGDTTTTADTLNIVVTHEVSYVANFERDSAWAARLESVTDEPADQGGQAVASWLRSPLDDPQFGGLLCCYELQRRPEGSVSAPWVMATSLPVSATPSYLAVVPSPADSTVFDSALYRYRLIAKAATDTFTWVSNEVVGYTVDNLAPPAPAYVTGVIASGTAALFWPVSPAPDVSHYAIYRSFQAAPPIVGANRIGTTTATGYSDAPGSFAYYAVTAVDVHGNEGPPTAFVPSNPANVGDGPAPPSLMVGAPIPSPMSRAMALTIGLPRAMHVTVDVLDAQGRNVRRLTNTTHAAGWMSVAWDAQDADGRVARAGMYFVRVRTPLGERVSRLVLLP